MSDPTFYLGSHRVSQKWWDLGVPLCVSRRVMPKTKVPTARAAWILDSGGFTELSMFGEWRTSEDEYVSEVARLREAGLLAWVAPMDWMCEPFMLERTGLTLAEHQRRTVENFVSLRERLGPLVIPVIQGYAPRDYDRCIDLYQNAGVDLSLEPTVGLGSVCRRSRTKEIVRLVRYLSDHNLRFHGFGLKGDSWRALRGLLVSADSMAWSFHARKTGGNANGLEDALAWRSALLAA